jgi:ketosteroid isomerase-like protein
MADNAKEEILALLKAQDEATARGDAEAVVAAGAPDIVRYDLPPPLEYRGDREGEIAGLKEWFATWDGPVTTEFAKPTVLIDGDLAVAYGFSRMRGNKKGDGPIDSWNRRTVVLRRSSGRWRILHEHSSYPMAMDGSGRAETGLKPAAGAI